MALEVRFYPDEIPAYLAERGGLRALTPDEESVLYVYGEALLDYIVRAWPVDTGTSQDAFSFYTAGDPAQGYGIVVENPMYYAEYVHLRDHAAEPPLWRLLFPEAWATVKPPLLRALFTAIDATEDARRAEVEAGIARGASARRARATASRELSSRATNPIDMLRRALGLA